MAKKKTDVCSKCGAAMWPDYRAAQPRVCVSCKRAECGTHQGHRSHRHYGETPCEPCRLAWNAYCAERQREAHQRGWERPKYARECGQCGSSFTSRNPDARYCSSRCVGNANRKPRSRDLVHVGPKLHRDAPPTPLNLMRTPRRVIVNGPCAWCREDFTAVTFTASARYCSKQCARNAGKYARGRFLITPAARLAIYERDNWTCQICMDPIDRAADYLDDWAPSLDHIVPQSHALIPDHSPANLRTAHRWCNSIRGDLSYYSDADLQSA